MLKSLIKMNTSSRTLLQFFLCIFVPGTLLVIVGSSLGQWPQGPQQLQKANATIGCESLCSEESHFTTVLKNLLG